MATQEMTDQQYKVLLESIRKMDRRIDDLEKVTNTISKDIGDDRKKIDDVVLATEANTKTVNIMREDVNNLSKKTTEVVGQAVDDHVAPVTKLLKEVNKDPSKKGLLSWLFKKK